MKATKNNNSRLQSSRTTILVALMVLTSGLALAQSHSLKGTYFVPGDAPQTIPANQWTAVGPEIDIVCPGSSRCTIEAVQSIQIPGPVADGNYFLFDFRLDGLLLDPVIDQEIGEIPTNGSFLTLSATEFLGNLSPGKHTVQTFLYSLDGTPVSVSNTTYRVYNP